MGGLVGWLAIRWGGGFKDCLNCPDLWVDDPIWLALIFFQRVGSSTTGCSYFWGASELISASGFSPGHASLKAHPEKPLQNALLDSPIEVLKFFVMPCLRCLLANWVWESQVTGGFSGEWPKPLWRFWCHCFLYLKMVSLVRVMTSKKTTNSLPPFLTSKNS